MLAPMGEGPPSTTLLITARKDVDGRPEPVLGRAFGPTRGPTMTVSATVGSLITAVGITAEVGRDDDAEIEGNETHDIGFDILSQLNGVLQRCLLKELRMIALLRLIAPVGRDDHATR